MAKITKTKAGDPIQGVVAKTVGELRAALATLPDDMPIHHRGNMGEFPLSATMVLLTLADSLAEPGYFAAIEIDRIWSKPNRRKAFGPAFKALCSI